MKDYLELFLTFAKIGVMTFGGGAAMLPMLKREVVENKSWVTEEELLDYYAIGQCTPGIIAVNTATFVGFKKKGNLGGVFATAGIIFPSLIIIVILAGLITRFSHIPRVQSAFAGIRACVTAQIAGAVISLSKKSVIDIPTCIIFILVLFGSYFLKLSPIIFVILAAALGIVLKVFRSKTAGGMS